MEKVFIIFTAVLLLALSGCSSLKPAGQDAAEIANLKAEAGESVVRLSWDMANSGKVEKIEVSRNSVDTPKYYKLMKELNKSENSVELTHPAYVELEYKVVLKFNDGRRSSGRFIRATAKHKSVILDKIGERGLEIYLPPSYKISDKRYPVIYMHDGQDMFTTTNFDSNWEVDKTMDRLIAEDKVEECIVVAIYNRDRVQDFIPYMTKLETEWSNCTESKSKELGDFIAEKLVPYIDNKYRTLPSRENRAIFGCSLAGLYSLWEGLTYSNIFSMIGSISPAYDRGDGKIIDEVKSMSKKNMKIWIDMGTSEWDPKAREMSELLEGQGYQYENELMYYEVKDGYHVIPDWIKRIHAPILFFKGRESNRKVVDFKIEVELPVCFETGELMQIVNPVGMTKDGISYSLMDKAEYISLDKEAGIVDGYGKFKFLQNKDFEILARYENIEKKIRLDKKEIDAEIKRRGIREKKR